MSVTTCTTLRLVQSLYHHHFALLTTGDYHLGDALTIVDDEVLLREVDQHDTNLTTIVGIDGTWGVQHGQSMLQGQSTTWAHLCFITFGQCDIQSGGYQAALLGTHGDRLFEVGTQVHASTLRCGVCGQRLVSAIDYLYLYHVLTLINNVQRYK